MHTSSSSSFKVDRRSGRQQCFLKRSSRAQTQIRIQARRPRPSRSSYIYRTRSRLAARARQLRRTSSAGSELGLDLHESRLELFATFVGVEERRLQVDFGRAGLSTVPRGEKRSFRWVDQWEGRLRRGGRRDGVGLTGGVVEKIG
jgi:hypothetical protein